MNLCLPGYHPTFQQATKSWEKSPPGINFLLIRLITPSLLYLVVWIEWVTRLQFTFSMIKGAFSIKFFNNFSTATRGGLIPSILFLLYCLNLFATPFLFFASSKWPPELGLPSALQGCCPYCCSGEIQCQAWDLRNTIPL